MQTDDLDDMLHQARTNNAARGVTGALIYVDGVFLQILEGERATLQGLMARISKDVRHETVTVLKEGDVPFASFADWTMAYVSATAAQVARWAGLSATAAMPDTLNDLHNDAQRTAQLAGSILKALIPGADPSAA